MKAFLNGEKQNETKRNCGRRSSTYANVLEDIPLGAVCYEQVTPYVCTEKTRIAEFCENEWFNELYVRIDSAINKRERLYRRINTNYPDTQTYFKVNVNFYNIRGRVWSIISRLACKYTIGYIEREIRTNLHIWPDWICQASVWKEQGHCTCNPLNDCLA